MTPLIHPDDAWTIWAVIAIGTMTAIWLEQSYRWAAKLSGPVLALLIAMLLSNFGVMPTESPSYDFVGQYLIPLAIPLLLLRANLWRIARETGGMFAAFHVSIVGTIAGAAVATLLLRDKVDSAAEIAGIMTASYSGGSVNFFAVRESFGIDENLTSPLLVADNFIMAGMFLFLLGLSSNRWLQRHFPTSQAPEKRDGDVTAVADHWRRKSIGLLDIAKSLAVAFCVVAVASQISRLVGLWEGPSLVTAVAGNLFVLITFFSLLFATIFHGIAERIQGPEEIGSFMLYLFLFVIGLPADLLSVVCNVPLLFLFCLIMALTNLAVTLTLGRLLRLNLEELLLCVNATLGGAPSAAAMAITKGWSELVVPAILVGIWGYVIGTFLGVLIGELLRQLC